MKLLAETRRILYDSITVGANEFLREHFLLAEQNRTNFHLFGAQAALFAQRRIPTTLFNFVTRSYRKHGFEVVGLGYHSVVIADGENAVRKIHHRTLHMFPEQRNAYIDRLYHKQRVLQNFFPENMVTDQEFVVEEFPANPDLPVVVSKQPRIYGKFLSREEILRTDAITNPSREMFENARTLPDIVGKENVVIPANGDCPVVIDTIPLSEHDPSDYAAFLAAESIMGEALRRANYQNL
ncbi:hypothetical protein [Corynebacterium freiburgense]|uniref:hypothetical protein n=1 Tax=Corynebacterium freiburgense TaxID=556548 RepID=UPI00041F72D3|nr:hypothetical protein [Corynebacterium freiburgense]WJZ01857.1 hypothetical protein CFREI_02765 [Corynebacterium freiburgense]